MLHEKETILGSLSSGRLIGSQTMREKPTQLVLVGCGALSELYYAPALKGLGSAEAIEVTALVDLNPRRLEVLGGMFPKARRLSTIEELAPDEADFAVVASPQKFHGPQSISLLRRGIHVLCEKPMASNVTEARSMVFAAQQANRLLSVGLFRRFFPSSELMHQLVTGLALGAPISFRWMEGGPFNWPAASASFFQKSTSPGGVFADVGVHVLDLLLSWFGEPVDCDYEDDAMGGIEANVRLGLRFASGVTGVLRLSRDTAIPNGTNIRFQRGAIWFQGASADSVSVRFDGSSHTIQGTLHELSDGGAELVNGVGVASRTYAQSFMEQIVNFCRAIRGEEPLRVPGEEALRGMELIDRCYASRRVMPMPWLTVEEREGIARLSVKDSPLIGR